MLRFLTTRSLKERTLARFFGLPPRNLEVWSNRFYKRVLLPRLKPKALDEIDRARNEGFRIVLATGAFDFLIQPFLHDLEIEAVVCTRTVISKGQFAGRIDGVECRGPEKLAALRELLGKDLQCWRQSTAYSDNPDDIDLLSAVGKGVFVGKIPPKGLAGRFRFIDF